MYPFALKNSSLAPASYVLQSGMCPLAILCVWAVKFPSFPGISNKELPQLQEIHLLCPKLEKTRSAFCLPILLLQTLSTFFFFGPMTHGALKGLRGWS